MRHVPCHYELEVMKEGSHKNIMSSTQLLESVDIIFEDEDACGQVRVAIGRTTGCRALPLVHDATQLAKDHDTLSNKYRKIGEGSAQYHQTGSGNCINNG